MKEITTNNHLKYESTGELSKLRDSFAGLAMQQFLSGARLPENYDAADEFRMCSERAYEMADAMLKQRSLTNV